MALEQSAPSLENPNNTLPDAYWRVEAIHIEPTARTASCLLYGYANAAAAALAKKQMSGQFTDNTQQRNQDGSLKVDGEGNPVYLSSEPDPDRPLPRVQIIGQESFNITGNAFDLFAYAQLQQQGNVLAVAYQQAKASSIFAGATDA